MDGWGWMYAGRETGGRGGAGRRGAHLTHPVRAISTCEEGVDGDEEVSASGRASSAAHCGDGARGDGAHCTSAGKMRLTRHGADRRELPRAVRTIASLTSPSTFLSLSGSLRLRAGAGPCQREEGVDDRAGWSAKAG